MTLGYVRQETNRRYSLGARLLYLGDAAGRRLGAWGRRHLIRLARSLVFVLSILSLSVNLFHDDTNWTRAMFIRFTSLL